jgi:hypothetical protein
VKKGVAAGKIESGRTAPTAKAARKTKEVSATKALKDAGLKPTKAAVERTVKRMAKEVVAASKSPEEVAKIKAANLARMKEVSAKQKKYNQIARPDGPGVDGFDADVARAEVQEMLEDDSFAMPKFLSKDQVKAMV